MKNLFTAVLLFATIYSARLFSQNLPNAGFENWYMLNYYEEPVGFWTANFQTYLSGKGIGVTKTTDAHSSSFAARLESMKVDSQNIPGIVGIGVPGPGGISGGYPFNDLPDSLIGYVKYKIAPSDTAILMIIFTAAGVPIVQTSIRFANEQTGWTRFSIPLLSQLPVQPDTLKFLMATSQNFDKGVAGNVLYVDDLSFTGTALTFPNGSFEDWVNISSEEPAGWVTTNIFNAINDPSVSKTTDAHSGSTAIRLENKQAGMGPPNSVALLGRLGSDKPEGGFALSKTPLKITGYYKYSPVSTDSSAFVTQFSRWNPLTQRSDSLAFLHTTFDATSVYRPFEFAFAQTWSQQPDTMIFGFSPSLLNQPESTISLGSTLIVDDLELFYTDGTSVSLDPESPRSNCSTQVRDDEVIFTFRLKSPGNLQLNIYDINGRIIRRQECSNVYGETTLTQYIGDLSCGVYHYWLHSHSTSASGAFVVR